MTAPLSAPPSLHLGVTVTCDAAGELVARKTVLAGDADRLQHEVDVLVRLQGLDVVGAVPGSATVHLDGHQAWVDLVHLDATPLAEAMDGPPTRLLAALASVARTLEAAHARGVSHGRLDRTHILLVGGRTVVCGWSDAGLQRTSHDPVDLQGAAQDGGRGDEDMLGRRETAEVALRSSVDAGESTGRTGESFSGRSESAVGGGEWLGGPGESTLNGPSESGGGASDSALGAGEWIGRPSESMGSGAGESVSGRNEATVHRGEWIGRKSNPTVNGPSESAVGTGEWIGRPSESMGRSAGQSAVGAGESGGDRSEWVDGPGESGSDRSEWVGGPGESTINSPGEWVGGPGESAVGAGESAVGAGEWVGGGVEGDALGPWGGGDPHLVAALREQSGANLGAEGGATWVAAPFDPGSDVVSLGELCFATAAHRSLTGRMRTQLTAVSTIARHPDPTVRPPMSELARVLSREDPGDPTSGAIEATAHPDRTRSLSGLRWPTRQSLRGLPVPHLALGAASALAAAVLTTMVLSGGSGGPIAANDAALNDGTLTDITFSDATISDVTVSDGQVPTDAGEGAVTELNPNDGTNSGTAAPVGTVPTAGVTAPATNKPCPTTAEELALVGLPRSCIEPLAVTVNANLVRIGDLHYQVGNAEDRVILSDPYCQDKLVAILLQPADGGVYVYDQWASTERPSSARPLGQVPGAAHFTEPIAPSCGPVSVVGQDGTVTELGGGSR
ncbi:MAG: hypothetical protein ACKV2O_17815 [Acidimicrobiales bacterium]